MSYLKSKTRPKKYDKVSIEFKKEYERLSKKSKVEYESLEKNDKTELLLSEGLSVQKSVPKLKEFARAKQGKIDYVDQNENVCVKDDQPDTLARKKPQASTKGKKEIRLQKTEDLKTKPRLHEQGVVSIRPDNPDLKVVMQGKKIEKKSEDKEDVQTDEGKQGSYQLDYDEMLQFYNSMPPFDIPTTNLPAKFAITGSQNTSMPVSLAQRNPPDERGLSSATSKGTRSLVDDEPFILPWSSESSSSGRRSSCRTASRGDRAEDRSVEDEKYKPVFKDVLSRLQSGGEGEKLSVSQLIQMKLKQITSGNIDTVDLDKSSHASHLDVSDKNEDLKVHSEIETTDKGAHGGVISGKSSVIADEKEDSEIPRENEATAAREKGIGEEGEIEGETLSKVQVNLEDDSFVPEEAGEPVREKDETTDEVEERKKTASGLAKEYPPPTLQDLLLPLKVTASDIVSISGKKAEFVERPGVQSKYIVSRPETAGNIQREVTFLSTWQDKEKATSVKVDEKAGINIHHFCSQTNSVELPAHLTRISRDMHTVDKHRVVAHRYRPNSQDPLPRAFPISDAVPGCCEHIETDVDWTQAAGDYELKRKLSDVARGILKNAGRDEETLENLQKVAKDLFSGISDEPLTVEGVKIVVKDDSTRFYWTPAPPKLHLSPSTIRDQMFPAYQGAPVLKASTETEYETVQGSPEDSDEDEVSFDKLDPEDAEARQRVLQRTHGSLSNIMDDLSRKPVKSLTGENPRASHVDVVDRGKEGVDEKFLSVLDVRRQMAKIKDSLRCSVVGNTEPDDTELFSGVKTQRRQHSQPDLSNELSLCFDTGYNASMQELGEQMSALEAIKMEKRMHHRSETPISPKIETYGEKQDSFDLSSSLNADSFKVETEQTDKIDIGTETASVFTSSSKAVFSTPKPGKISRKPQLSYVRRGKKDVMTEKERLRRKKIMRRKVQAMLSEPPRVIKRSKSLQFLSNERGLTRSRSLPCLFDYKVLDNENMTGDDLFFWVQDEYWYKWLDEVYPPSLATPDILRDIKSSLSDVEIPTSAISPNILDEVEVIEPHVDESSRQLYEDLKKEVEKISDLIDEAEKQETLALYLARRGAIYRKLGHVKKAWEDLERSIELEPQLLTNRWHRHLLHLLNNNPKKALEDLTYITKKNSNIVKVFLSKAEIYKKQGDSTMAILNYSQAIKLNPGDADVYYNRAALFLDKGDVVLALEDYKKASELQPSRTDAMFYIGKYNFNQNHWPAAVKCFTAMLKQDPLDAKAYLFRGKAFAKQGIFKPALKDLSSALHLDPRSSEAFFHRGCLLRKINPQKAIQDLSVSLLLDSSVDNVNAFLHRGIIYTDLKRWDEAVCDFEFALRLDKCIACAHVNIGLIMITKHESYGRAIKRFSAAVRVDPTYVRGYVCRAEAYDKLGHLKEAIDDFTRVIHLRPVVADHRMSRGKLLLKQNKLELASFHIRQAAELSQGLGGSATQQAIVHAFLRDYDKAIDILTRATRITPTTTMLILLGKTCMKAKEFENAIASFKRAIYSLTPWHPRIQMPLEAATVYFMIGTCYTELNNPTSALDAFNNAIKVNPDYAEAYYNRGLTKMKLKHAKSIHDFNRALAINPKLFQAFLSRAAYYGTKGRFSKGIMNCNEAIKLQPRSVRAYLYRGALKFHISAYKLAVRDLTEAIAIDCTCLLAYFNRAVCYQAMKYYQKALIDYSTVLLSSEELDVKVLQNRGLLYLDIDDMDNALMDFSQAAKVSPNNPKILHTLGLCYHKLNRLQDSVKSYTEALRCDPFFKEAYIGRGNTLMDYGHNVATRYARFDYLKALHIDPLCLPARVNLAYNLQVEGKFQKAWDQFTAALNIDKNFQAALEGRAIVNLQMANTFAAFVDMNDCLKISKTAELLTNRGVVQQFMGDTVNAMRDYQAAIRLEPCYSLAYYNAANLYFKQRQFQQALSYYEKASSWNPQDESAVLNAAITKVLLKQFDSALCDFQKAIELSPYSAHIFLNRGNLYASLGRYEQAENDYTHALELRPGDALTYKRRADVRGKLSRREEAIEDYKMAIVIQTSAKQR
ncbi:uncharacterized protein LOC114536089 isoform X2 [Dendronephthya gigantea]|uniref:uncharacterized protein LOC114536089 isoform X2 n=1 Tax=Dendronephthya gigantea TaxID=151771 RepID=UPI00106A6EEA|nr:uncharacterized protein LOC114536089 isoform X2 [Dendronephthya gigantea]